MNDYRLPRIMRRTAALIESSKPNVGRCEIAMNCTRIMLLLLFASATSTCFGELRLEKIGNPTFGISEVTGSIPNANPWAPTMEILGDSYIDIAPFQPPIFPKSSADNSIDRHVRERFASSGMVNTDAFLVENIAYNNMRMNLLVLTAADNAEIGPSLDSSDVPVISNDIFPIRFEDNHLFINGAQVPSEFTVEVPSLGSRGEFTDDDGISYDFSALNYSGFIFPNWRGGNPTSASTFVGTHEAISRVVDQNGDGWEVTESYVVVETATDLEGDLNYNGELDMHDLDILTQNVAVAPAVPHGEFLRRLDLNGDDTVDSSDVHHWIIDLKSTSIGDANLDGVFGSEDIIGVFAAGKYDTGQLASWSEGDWNADELFDSADVIAAMQGGGYVMEARPAVAAVPEPSSWLMLSLGLFSAVRFRRR